MNCGVGHRCGSDPELLWLWCSPAAVAPIRPLAWKIPYATGAALKQTNKQTKRQKKKKKTHFSWASVQGSPPACYWVTTMCLQFNLAPTPHQPFSMLSTTFRDRFWCPSFTDEQREVQRDQSHSHETCPWENWDLPAGPPDRRAWPIHSLATLSAALRMPGAR